MPPSILRIFQGYEIPFIRSPPLKLPSAASFTVLLDPKQICVIDEEIEAMLLKGAIDEVAPSRGYYSRVFCVPKKEGGWRPIINLKRLNKEFLDLPPFRMDTAKNVALLLRPGDWAASIDLKDTYFDVPVNRRF